MNRTAFLGASLSATVARPALAAAQQPTLRDTEMRLFGRVIYYRPWNLQLDNGPHIYLHPGTVIRPTGTTLANGMHVRVWGHRTADDTFAADEIVVLGDDENNGPQDPDDGE